MPKMFNGSLTWYNQHFQWSFSQKRVLKGSKSIIFFTFHTHVNSKEIHLGFWCTQGFFKKPGGQRVLKERDVDHEPPAQMGWGRGGNGSLKHSLWRPGIVFSFLLGVSWVSGASGERGTGPEYFQLCAKQCVTMIESKGNPQPQYHLK